MVRPAALMGLLCTVVQRPPLLPPVADAGHGEGVGVTGSQRDTLLNFRCHTVNVSGSPMGQLSQVRVIANQPMCPITFEPVILSKLLESRQDTSGRSIVFSCTLQFLCLFC